MAAAASVSAQAQLTREVATFAGGCFWCLEAELDGLDGVISAVSGYTGGSKENPTYEEVSSGTTGHAEAVQIEFDPSKITYAKLLEIYWRNIDPTDAGGQFYDRGSQYRTAIFYHSESQRLQAETSKKAAEEKLGQPLATEIQPVGAFYTAEDYHQNYHEKNPLRYRSYKSGSGREHKLRKLWGPEEPE